MSQSLLLLLVSSIVLATGSNLQADEAPKAVPASECRFTETPPKIDGVGDDAAWKAAQLLDKFTLPWLKEKERPAKTATKARLLWDREFLYFLAEMDDTDLYADVTEADGQTWDNDVFELFFKPAADKPGYYEFQINAAGTTMDMFLPRRGAGGFKRFIKEGDFHLETKVKLNGSLNKWSDKDQGWTVEGRMPWTDFLRTGGRPAVDEVWTFALCRYDYSVDFEGPELSTMAPLKTNGYPNFHFFEDYAELKFVRNRGAGDKGQGGAAANPKDTPHPNPLPSKARGEGTGFDPRGALPKLVTSRVIGSPEPPLPYRTEKRYPKLKVNYPIAIVHQPGSDRLWTITQDRSYATTVIERFVDSPDVSETEVLLPKDERVAYDIAFHPRFAENGFVYIGHNRPKPVADDAVSGKEADDSKKEKKTEKYSTVSRFRVNPRPPYEFDPKSETVVVEWLSDGHNGAAITFGLDGMLYVTTGDGTSDSDTNVRGQDMTKLTAKVLRIDVDHPDEGKMYSVPKDNPFVGKPNMVPETWAIGLRNPWRMTTDRVTGHIWVGNNGQDLWEQVYFVRKGDNYGWSVYEGSHPFYLTRELGPTPHVKPAMEHHHSEARSLTGGIVCYGKERPELKGVYIYGDHSTGKVWGARHDGQKVTSHQELVDTPFHITGFGTDAQGELLICDHAPAGEGGFHTLVPAPADAPKTNFPRTLSESGLFRSVQGHELEPSLIPYSVNSPLWSDGTDKVRAFGIPGDSPKIDFNTGRAWGLPNETVIVKSFALDLVEGDPKSRRWIETRFLTKQQNEWIGYSYQWNDEQTDGVLVAKEGFDREFTIRTADGSRQQKWHYPSRTECMVCHSRAAGFVLGLSTLQMNRNHDYGGGHVENQLSALERLDLFQNLDHAAEARNQFKEDFQKGGLTEKEANDKVAALTASRDQRGSVKSSLLALSPDKYERLVDPYDPREKLEARARSYLHSNCSICHVEAGGGNAQMQLEWKSAMDKTKLLNEVPIHDKFNLPDARLVAPGHPERSVLLHRVAMRGRGQMPQLATVRVDQPAVDMLTEWIRQMSTK